MKAPQILLSIFLGLTLPPGLPPIDDPPIPPGAATNLEGPARATWSEKKTARIKAMRVRLNGYGARTHNNWVFFRLPFSTESYARVKATFAATSDANTDVGALRVGSICVPFKSSGGVDNWSLYTTSGIGHTERYRAHIRAPTHDPTILAINVPTRVANYVACGRDEGNRLLDPNNWTLTVEWQER